MSASPPGDLERGAAGEARVSAGAAGEARVSAGAAGGPGNAAGATGSVGSPGAPADLIAARPAIDRLQMELARASAEQRLFGKAEPARVGRFVLLGSVAMGGMGAVYGAFDPQLQRRVALKVLHPQLPRSEVRRERLLAEARALARLVHPHVVAVYDAMIVDDQVVIVMEWVEGQTLAQWERERPRPWRELVAMYLQAGRGLAAIHALGLIHRDFKPANAILGADGRVRILDFGLARFDRFDAEPPAPLALGSSEGEVRQDATAGEDVRTPLTSPGEVLGTLAFMAPEQLAGEQASPASDQFSFCVALYRALHGCAPYAGRTVAELLASMRAGPARETRPARRRAASATPAPAPLRDGAAGSRVPAALRCAVARGISPEPADRFPSMEALLEELGREHGWRRWRTPGVAAATAAAALIAFELVADRSAAAPSCDTGAAEIAASWDERQRDLADRALSIAMFPNFLNHPASDPEYSSAVRSAVLDGLDGYSRAWAAMHRAACVAHREGAQSAAVLDLRMACLRRRKDALSAAGAALRQVDARSALRAREVVARLPPISDCDDLEALAAAVPPPPTPEARQQASALEARLANAVAMERLGHSTEALAQVRGLGPELERLAYPPLLVEALLVEGRIALGRDEVPAAQPPLARAEELGLEHGLLPQATVAAARRIFAEALTGVDPAGLLRQVALLEPLSRHLRGDAFARPLLLNNLGVLHLSMGQRERALDAFSRARRAIDTTRPVDLELTIIDRNLALLTRAAPEREALARGAWQRYRDQLGERHLSALEALLAYGKYVDDPAQALPLIRQACELYRAAHPELYSLGAQCVSYQGFLMFELGDLEGAAATYDQAAAIAAAAPDGAEEMRRLLARGWAALLRGRAGEARPAFEEVVRQSSGDSWWMRAWAAQAHLGLGMLPPASPGDRASVEHLTRAVDIFAEVSEINEDTELKRRLALARFTLAVRGRGAGDSSTRAAGMARAAAAFYEQAGAASYRRRLDELAAAP